MCNVIIMLQCTPECTNLPCLKKISGVHNPKPPNNMRHPANEKYAHLQLPQKYTTNV